MADGDNSKPVFSKFSRFPFHAYNPDLEEVGDFLVTWVETEQFIFSWSRSLASLFFPSILLRFISRKR